MVKIVLCHGISAIVSDQDYVERFFEKTTTSAKKLSTKSPETVFLSLRLMKVAEPSVYIIFQKNEKKMMLCQKKYVKK